MTDPRPPAWQAVEIGPGALDPLLIRPVGVMPYGGMPPGVMPQGGMPQGVMPPGRDPAAYGPGSMQQYGQPGLPYPDRSYPDRQGPVPAHVMDHQPGYLLAAPPIVIETVTPQSRWRRLRSSKHFGTLVIGVIIAVILTAVIWATAVVQNDEVSVGDCMTLGTLLPTEVSCDSADAEFRVISRYDNSTDYTRCASDEPDAGLSVGNAVLCVNYVARVGDCLYADEGSSVGKEPCSSQLDGLYQVIEVVTNSLDSGRCPEETEQVLVHRSELEVICLIENP